MKKEFKDQMRRQCAIFYAISEEYLLLCENEEADKIYWTLIKDASQAWLEQNAKTTIKKKAARKRPMIVNDRGEQKGHHR